MIAMKSLLLLFVACTLSAAAQKTIPVTVTVNGVTYTGTLSAESPGGNTPGNPSVPQGNPSAPQPHAADTASREPGGKPRLPRQMMTAEWPLNQSIANLPPDTRRLKIGQEMRCCGVIDEQFHAQYQPGAPAGKVGYTHLGFDTSMPITVVDTRQTPNIFAAVKMTTTWTNNDASHVPVVGCKIEGGNSAPPTADRHCLIFDAATGIDYELFNVNVKNGTYSAQAYKPWDTNTPQQGKLGEDSADAAGLPILPLLLRYQEAASGTIHHALRFTLPHSRANQNSGFFVAPASHAAGDIYSVFDWMGMRLRLRPDFPTAGLSRTNQAIVACLKTYGLVLADNGGPYITADNDPRWDAGDLQMLSKLMSLADFTPVNTGNIVDSEGNVAQ